MSHQRRRLWKTVPSLVDKLLIQSLHIVITMHSFQSDKNMVTAKHTTKATQRKDMSAIYFQGAQTKKTEITFSMCIWMRQFQWEKRALQNMQPFFPFCNRGCVRAGNFHAPLTGIVQLLLLIVFPPFTII